jgi:multiple sugar transport system permease protein
MTDLKATPATSRRHSRTRTPVERTGSAARYLVLVLGAGLFLVPFYLLVRNGLSTNADITSPRWKLFPTSIQWGNVSELFSDPAVPMLHSMFLSLVVSLLQTAGSVLIGALAGYGLARIPFRYANLVLGFIIATLLIPSAVTFVPTSLGWVSSLQGLIVPGLFQALIVFLFRQYFVNFPRELEDAGRVDGLGYPGTFFRIVVPNSLAFVAAVSTITFIGSWNAFLWPLVIGQDSASWTVQIALSTFLTAQTINLHELFIAATFSILPILLLFLGLQRFIVQGVESTGINS